jgi:hypothetical protein
MSSQGRPICHVHARVRIGITLNLNDNTLSFSVNGLEKGVAFTNLPPDTYFPSVCLYYKVRCIASITREQLLAYQDWLCWQNARVTFNSEPKATVSEPTKLPFFASSPSAGKYYRLLLSVG